MLISILCGLSLGLVMVVNIGVHKLLFKKYPDIWQLVISTTTSVILINFMINL